MSFGQRVSEFFRGIMNKIMVVAGISLLVASVALFTAMYQLLSGAVFLSGVFLVLLGVVLHFETLSWKVPSREGWGTIAICFAVMLMATTVVVLLYAVPGEVFTWLQRKGARSPLVLYVLFDLNHPIAWLAPIFACVSVGFLVLGVFLKFSREIF
jgi:hypothetical protein